MVLFLELYMLSWMCRELLSIEAWILGLVFLHILNVLTMSLCMVIGAWLSLVFA